MASPKIRVESPLGAGALLLRTLRGHEQLGRLFSYTVELASVKPIAKLSALLGHDITIVLDLADGGSKCFHGYVTEIESTATDGRYFGYLVKLRPWFWFLTRTSNCRIFQSMTVPDIIKQVFRERGFTDVEDALSDSYPTCEYTVQYRESEFNFLSRLMEREGIYYYFRHEEGKHTLVLADGQGAHHTVPGYETVPFYPPQQKSRRERDHIDSWSLSHNIQPGAYVLNDYDFKRPKANLEAKLTAPLAHNHDDYENFDYPGEYVRTSDGENYARVRLQELHAQFETFRGTGNVRGLSAGAIFKLSNLPIDDQNQEYLLSDVRYELDAGSYESTNDAGADMFRCTMEAVTSTTPFRAARLTAKPVVNGPQTAKVVGKSGEEIWTDEFGRVKVQFHWDREAKGDQNSSCWVRVSQVMAGASWGAMHVPRIGQEVVVSFLEGDPDQPLITGRVYNGTNKPPFGLPSAGMVSGIKTDSTPGGSGYNEISLDDTKGKEKIVIHGQFDMNSTIEHDQTLRVHNNRSQTIDVDDTESVGNNQGVTVGTDQTISVGAKHTLTVGDNQTVTVGGNRSESIAKSTAVAIGAKYELSVASAMKETIGGPRTEEVAGDKKVQVGKSSNEIVTDDRSVSAGKSLSASAGKDVTLNAGKKLTVTAGDDLAISGKKKGVIEVADELTIKVGSAQITLKKNGDITIKGKKITLNGSGDLVLKGSKVTQN